jgi:AraC-like DNA-binding protein
VADYAISHGVSRDGLLAAAGLSQSSLGDPDGRISLLSLYDLVEYAEAQLGDPCLGLHFTTTLSIGDMDALGFLMATSPTFGSAMERMFEYQRIWAEGERFEMKAEGGLVRVTYEPYGSVRPAHVQMAQMAFADMVVNGSRLVPGLEYESIRFRHAAPADVRDEYERVLSTPVVFDVHIDELRFDERLLELRMPDSNAAMCSFFDRYAREKLEQLPNHQSVTLAVRDRLRTALPVGQIKLDQVAAQLHMSPRTLQRRLSEEGTSLHAELDEVRRQQALYFLETGVAIAELSWLLGYSEPSVFHRAFKRWTNTSPETWRANHQVPTEAERGASGASDL